MGLWNKNKTKQTQSSADRIITSLGLANQRKNKQTNKNSAQILPYKKLTQTTGPNLKGRNQKDSEKNSFFLLNNNCIQNVKYFKYTAGLNFAIYFCKYTIYLHKFSHDFGAPSFIFFCLLFVCFDGFGFTLFKFWYSLLVVIWGWE